MPTEILDICIDINNLQFTTNHMALCDGKSNNDGRDEWYKTFIQDVNVSWFVAFIKWNCWVFYFDSTNGCSWASYCWANIVSNIHISWIDIFFGSRLIAVHLRVKSAKVSHNCHWWAEVVVFAGLLSDLAKRWLMMGCYLLVSTASIFM